MPSIVVTGASRGIGLSVARHLASAGNDVVALARRHSRELAEAMEECARGGGRLHFHPVDLSHTEELASVARDLWRAYGPLCALVNNAGTGPASLLATARDRDIEETVRLNVLSPILLTKYLSRRMMAEGEGRIVNIASVAGMTGFKGLSVYAATKAALIGFTRSLARELGPLGITVNAIAPGLVDTELTSGFEPAERQKAIRRSALRTGVDREDVAHAVAYLLGDGGKRVTGTVLIVDAGATA